MALSLNRPALRKVSLLISLPCISRDRALSVRFPSIQVIRLSTAHLPHVSAWASLKQLLTWASVSRPLLVGSARFQLPLLEVMRQAHLQMRVSLLPGLLPILKTTRFSVELRPRLKVSVGIGNTAVAGLTGIFKVTPFKVIIQPHFTVRDPLNRLLPGPTAIPKDTRFRAPLQPLFPVWASSSQTRPRLIAVSKVTRFRATLLPHFPA